MIIILDIIIVANNSAVLILAKYAVWKDFLELNEKSLKSDIVNSLTNNRITIHKGIRVGKKYVIPIRTDIIKILSAKGSKNFPKSVSIFNFLAINPSRKSVIPAIIRIIRAII
jgi:hypothetical protein